VDWLIFFIRLAITLTFLITATVGPWALVKLNKFIRRYEAAHKALEDRVKALEPKEQIIKPEEHL